MHHAVRFHRHAVSARGMQRLANGAIVGKDPIQPCHDKVVLSLRAVHSLRSQLVMKALRQVGASA